MLPSKINNEAIGFAKQLHTATVSTSAFNCTKKASTKYIADASNSYITEN
jgi:hypothetical protein